jgi:phosphohistidine swiveling domain-containing protein
MKSNISKKLENFYQATIAVLHVEDDLGVAKKFASELYKRNVYVHHVDNLSDAINVLKKCKVEFVVCDGRFPNFRGGKGGEANFIPLVKLIKKLNKNPKIIGWANSTTVHEYCHNNKLESYSKLKLSKESFTSRNRKFLNITKLAAGELADILEQKIAQKSGFFDAIKKLKLEHYYNEPGTVLGMFMAADVRTKLFEKTAGKNYGPMVSEINKGMLTVFVDKSNDAIIAESIYKKIINKNFFPEIEKNVNLRSKLLLKFARKLRKSDLKKYSNKELAKLYARFCMLFLNMRMYSSLPTAMEHETNAWSELLKSILKLKIKIEEEQNKIFSLLTTPTKGSYLNEFEFKLAKIGLKKYSRKEISSDIDAVLDKFTWINYHFEGTPLKQPDIIKKINELGKSKLEFEKLIFNHKQYFQNLKREKNEIYKKYSFSKKEINLFDIGSSIVFIKFYRKGIFAESYYSVEFLLKEIGRRIKCTRKQVTNMTAGEVLAALEVNFFPGELSDRIIRRSIMFHSTGETHVLEPYAERLLKGSLTERNISTVKELKGQTAYPGKAKGVVKIVNVATDMKKFKKNEILVSRSTNPSLIFVMKKASAIVTDLGGLTCHAAIVARELKKPCVVGTKNATLSLKDGDLVEVDADKGIIKKI